MRVLGSDDVAAALVNAGFISQQQANNISRVIIDARAGHTVMIYVEHFGEEPIANAIEELFPPMIPPGGDDDGVREPSSP